jgi:transcriptional regulator with XRE-family HTH domain
MIVIVTPGTMIRRAREQRRLSQRQVAIRAGTTQTAISRVEHDEVSPTIETMQRLLLAMGYRLDLAAEPMPGVLDERHHDEQLKMTTAQRLADAFGWNEFSGHLVQAGRRRQAAERSKQP